MSRLKKLWWLLIVVPVLAAAGFVVWAERTLPPMPDALSALESDGSVQVATERWLVFSPVSPEPHTGLILYPGGRVDPRSYAPTARAIAAGGHLVVIVPMPLNLAIFASGAAAEVIAAYPEVSDWAIGGHSLGGAMAARFVFSHPVQVQGLVLWAAYPDSSNNLSDRTLPVTSIYGTLDGLATTEKIEASRALLPRTTEWVAIEGGNHAQFGWYGAQSGDNPATITREEQQRQIIEATMRLLLALQQDQA
jgi:pimeloyl-ACP methyl ester carboxylesterase